MKTRAIPELFQKHLQWKKIKLMCIAINLRANAMNAYDETSLLCPNKSGALFSALYEDVTTYLAKFDRKQSPPTKKKQSYLDYFR